MQPRVLVLSRQGEHSLPPADVATLRRLADVRFLLRERAPTPSEAAELLVDVDLLAATNACLPGLDAELLDRAPDLQGVVLYATGYDHVDVDLLARHGAWLSVLPDYATEAVAEHALGMVFGLACRLHLAHDRSRGVVDAASSLRGVELAGRTAGVVGVGRIGTRVAQLARAIGMDVVGTDIDAGAVARAEGAGLEMTRLEPLLTRSDVVVVCASYRFGAPPTLGGAELQRMRGGAFLVNVSRSALVDTAAAAAAVRAGHLRGYAVDDVVLDPVADGDLLAQGRVLQTGHSGWWRDEVLGRGERMFGEHLIAAVRGRPLDVVPASDTGGPRVGVQLAAVGR